MKRLYLSIVLALAAFTMPAIAKDAKHEDSKHSNQHDIFTSSANDIAEKTAKYSGEFTFNSGYKVFADKAIILGAAPSHGSFQEMSDYQLIWWSQSNHFEGNNEFFGRYHQRNHWNSWLADNQHHGGEHGFHGDWGDKYHLGHHDYWEHGGGHEGHGGHDWDDDDHVTQPVPEPETYLLLLLGLLGIAALKRRQY